MTLNQIMKHIKAGATMKVNGRSVKADSMRSVDWKNDRVHVNDLESNTCYWAKFGELETEWAGTFPPALPATLATVEALGLPELHVNLG